MRHSNSLTARFVDTVKTAGIYRDKGHPGLFLRVEPTGSKRWVLRTTIRGKRRDIGLGSARDVSLLDARDQAAALRRAARTGGDPIEAKRAAKRKRLSFAEAAETVHAERATMWRSSKHGKQWIMTLRSRVFPVIGTMPVADVEPADVLKVLAPIWLTRPETARRIRQRMGIVLDWATTAGYRSSLAINAAHAVRAGLPKQPRWRRHHRAIPWREIPAFAAQVRATPSTESVRFALEFLLLTAARTSEVLGATWREIDLDNKRWTIPAERMKAGREHRVPLAHPALQILRECRERWPTSAFVFPGRSEGKPLSKWPSSC